VFRLSLRKIVLICLAIGAQWGIYAYIASIDPSDPGHSEVTRMAARGDVQGVAEWLHARLAGQSAKGEDPGETWAAGTRAQTPLSFRGGTEARFTPPAGYRVIARQTRPGMVWARFLLSAEGEAPINLMIGEAEGAGSDQLTAKIAYYAGVATQLGRQGAVIGNGLSVPVDEIHHDARGLFYCLKPEGEAARLTGGKLEAGLFVVATLREGCGRPRPADRGVLDAMVGRLTVDRRGG